MRKNNLIKSRKSKGVIAKAALKRKSIPSKSQNGATKTLVNGFADLKTPGKNSDWTDSLTEFPEMGKRLKEAIDLYQTERLEDAVGLLEKLIVDYPDQAPILWYLGGLYLDLGQPSRAISHYRRATQVSPRSERGSLGLFHALWDTDQCDEALEEMKRFQVLTDWSCRDYLEIMEEIKEKWLDEKPVKTKARKKTKS